MIMIRIDEADQIGATIVRLRRERGWLQGELARRAGIHQSVISEAESGKCVPASATLIKIFRAFEMQMAWVPIDVIR